MTRVVAPSRLHFGLLRAAGRVGQGPRFGGCGLMIDAPGVAVTAEPAATWEGTGPNAGRAVEFARRVTDAPHRIVVEQCPREHIGLGVGTALSLTVGKAVRPDLSATDLARLTGRGLRSGVGLHGFDLGGFIADAGKASDTALPRLAGRYPFPADWRVVLIEPDQAATWHGAAERAAFARLRDAPEAGRSAKRMEYLLGHDLVPAVAAADYGRFSPALGEYNRLAGEPFAAEQGGLYAGRVVAALVAAVAELGFPGVGQSSWGPVVFAVAPDPDRAVYLADAIRSRFSGLRSVEVVSAAVCGATVSAT